MIRQNQKLLNSFNIVLDFIVVIASLFASFWLAFRYFNQGNSVFLFGDNAVASAGMYILISLMYLALYSAFHLYRSYRNIPFWVQATELAKANLVAYIILVAFFCAFSSFDRVQVGITVFFFLSTFLQVLYRGALREFLWFVRKKGYNKKFLTILGYNEATEGFVKRIRNSPEFGYEISGYLAAEQMPGAAIPFLGKSSTLESYLQKNIVDEVFIMLKEGENVSFLNEIMILEKYGVKFSIIPSIFAKLPSRVYVTSFDNMPVLGMRKIPLDSLLNSFVKRAFDVLFSLLCLVLFSPLFLIAALMVKLTSTGPVIFRQTRVGINRKPFEMYKFRSMRVETESIVRMAGAEDDRCTSVGHFLRKYSIDELPQLVNVLKGDMSLVGPRPEIPHFVNQFMEYIPSYMIKHYVKPGMTGWAQVNGLRGGDTSIEERIQFDIDYIENWSFWFDIRILFRTAFKLCAGKKQNKEDVK